jgi:hypothetical protein
MPRPTSTYTVFVKAFREAQGDTLPDRRYQPYDLRRGFAVGCVLAGVTRSRRLKYLGHKPKDIQDLYEAEAEDIKRIKKDGTLLRRHFGKPPRLR